MEIPGKRWNGSAHGDYVLYAVLFGTYGIISYPNIASAINGRGTVLYRNLTIAKRIGNKYSGTEYMYPVAPQP